MNHRIQFAPGSLLLIGMILFSLQWKETAALFAAAAAHELGHLLAFFIFRIPILGVRFTISGPVLLYEEPNSRRMVIIAALSGPIAGFLLALILRNVWPICAKISFLLSIFNLLPVLPLDGGRIMSALCNGRVEGALAWMGYCIPIVLMLSGLICVHQGRSGFGLLVFGACLLLLSCQEHQFDVK